VNGVVVLTGAAGAIGRVFSEALVDAGYALAALDLAGAEELAEGLEARGGRALGLEADVTSRASVDAAIAATLELFGRIDGLVNNAAHYTRIVKSSFDTTTGSPRWLRC
jgi:NAD(P)-dependent dehydrogenase (short-subunit alcohol dehydrogenase family)